MCILPTRLNITVGIPVYNDTRWLDEAVASVVNQTPGKWNLDRIIIVDDGSEPPIGRRFYSKCWNLRVSHRGPANAFNTALMNTESDWFVLLHSDDYLGPDFFNECEKVTARDGMAVVILPTMVALRNEEPLYMIEPNAHPEDVWAANPHPYCAMFYTQTVKDVGGWHGEIPGFPDWGLWIDLHQRDKAFAVAPDAEWFYRKRDDSDSRNLTPERRARERDLLFATYGGFKA